MTQKLKLKIKNFRFTRSGFAWPYMAVLALFVVVPLTMILVNAFIADGKLSFRNFVEFFTSSSGMMVFADSLLIGVVTTLLCFAIGYPVAYFLVKYSSNKVFVMLFVLPMWVNFLIRTLATKAMFQLFDWDLGVGSVIFGMVYNYLPFMILPLHTTLSGIDKSYYEASADLGADPLNVIVKTLLPMSVPGILSGVTMVFIPTISTFAISQLLSNGTIYLFGDSIYTKFTYGLYGVGSVMSLVMIVLVLISNVVLSKFNKNGSGRTVW